MLLNMLGLVLEPVGVGEWELPAAPGEVRWEREWEWEWEWEWRYKPGLESMAEAGLLLRLAWTVVCSTRLFS